MFVKLYFIALPIFFALDMVWLGVAAKNFYIKQIGFLMKTNVNWVAAILFYLLFVVGLVVFVIAPSVEKDSWVRALSLGALFVDYPHTRPMRVNSSSPRISIISPGTARHIAIHTRSSSRP